MADLENGEMSGMTWKRKSHHVLYLGDGHMEGGSTGESFHYGLRQVRGKKAKL